MSKQRYRSAVVSLRQVNVTDARKSVVIVGRPNVGKSTLFNRFLGEQAAIVEDHPGVTRDRHTREVEWLGRHFNVVDTGGWMPGGSTLDSKVSRQVEDVIIDQLNLDSEPLAKTDNFVRDPETKEPRVAIVGRPNVGKSTLFNRLVGEERSIVHDMAGTTRDAIDTRVETENGPVVFVDTAGMRRRSKVDPGTEYYSIVRALRAVDEADIALLVIDAVEGVTSQDQRLAERVDASGCPIIVVLNKWELLSTERKEEVEIEMHRRLYF
ncbi:MAG: GTP-binding protein, partial [Actinobacteria bacterium]|nr:GTP-binding protein [Actinomycetota bacterium]